MEEQILRQLKAIHEAIERMNEAFMVGMKRLAMVPVAGVCCLGLCFLLWKGIITEWLWGSFMLVIMFSYFGDGIKYVFEKLSVPRGNVDAAKKLLLLGILLTYLIGAYTT